MSGFGKGLSTRLIGLMVTIGLCFFAGAQESSSTPVIDLSKGATFEVSPHTGAMGGSGLFGLRLSMNYGALNLEVAGEQVIGKTANTYPLMLNFVLNLSQKGKLLPYGLVGGGLMVTVPTDAIGARTVSTAGVNFGGGARLYLNRSFGFRLEAKQFVTQVANQISAEDELLIFQEVTFGVTFMFR